MLTSAAQDLPELKRAREYIRTMHEDSVLSRVTGSPWLVTELILRMVHSMWRESPYSNGFRTPFDLYVKVAYMHRGQSPASKMLPQFPGGTIPFFAYNEGRFLEEDIFHTDDATLPDTYRLQSWVILDMVVSEHDDVVPCYDLSSDKARRAALEFNPIPVCEEVDNLRWTELRHNRIPPCVKIEFSWPNYAPVSEVWDLQAPIYPARCANSLQRLAYAVARCVHSFMTRAAKKPRPQPCMQPKWSIGSSCLGEIAPRDVTLFGVIFQSDTTVIPLLCAPIPEMYLRQS
ncbi:unnamed protein product [Peniophora sp. CBMAI 1063]|nr:unnamed protein product [Peniophora sp. CBMAI 1063]